MISECDGIFLYKLQTHLPFPLAGKFAPVRWRPDLVIVEVKARNIVVDPFRLPRHQHTWRP
jgi:hypothetical protein